MGSPVKVQVSPLLGNERHGWVNPDLYAYSCRAFGTYSQPDSPFQLDLLPVVGLNPSQLARNHLSERFLEGTADYLLMIDNDHKPFREQDGFVDLIGMAKFGEPIVVSPCPSVRHHELMLPVYSLREDPQNGERKYYRAIEPVELFELAADHRNLLPVDAAGTGAVMIRRDVIAQMAARYDAIWGRIRKPTGETEVGEDLLFCTRAKALGFQTWVSLDHFSGHYHTVDLRTNVLLPMIEFSQGEPAEDVARLEELA